MWRGRASGTALTHTHRVLQEWEGQLYSVCVASLRVCGEREHRQGEGRDSDVFKMLVVEMCVPITVCSRYIRSTNCLDVEYGQLSLK